MEKISKYKILGELGRGAMGIVYKGVDPLIGRTVAIKTIRMDAFVKPHEQAEAAQRFIREAQSTGNLSHPNIVTIFDVGQSEGITYIAMEYIDGQSLDMLIALRKEFSLDEIIDLITQIGSALDYAHEKGVVHRDIKPGNILIDNSGKANIVDFGIARISTSTLTQTGTTLGTPNYMSPEQVAGRKVDHRSDIFALGAILYELLTYEKPFSGDSFTTIIYKIMNEDPPPLRTFNARMPEDLDVIIRKALAKKVEDRYQSSQALINDLSSYQTLGTTLMADGPLILKEEKIKKKETKKVEVKKKETEIPKSEKEPSAEHIEKTERKRNPFLIGISALVGIAAVVAAVYFIFLKGGGPIDSMSQNVIPPQERAGEEQVSVSAETSQTSGEIESLLEAGSKAFDNGDYDLCIRNMERILELDPQHNKADALLTEATKKQAEQQSEQGLESSLRLARNAYQEENYRAAIQQANRALSLDSNNSEARNFLLQSYLQLGVRSFDAGNYAQSIIWMGEVIKIDPTNKRAQDYTERARDGQAEQREALNIENTLLLAERAMANNDYQEALKEVGKVLKLDETNQKAKELWIESHSRLGKQAFDKEDDQSNIRHMEMILKYDSQNRTAIDSISRSKTRMNALRVEELLNQIQTAIDNSEYEKSLELSQAVLDLEPDNERAKKYFNQSSLQVAPQEINAIIEEYKQSVKDNTLIQFYTRRCDPGFYQTIKTQTETIIKSFGSLKIALSNLSIQFLEIAHAKVTFNIILTGISNSDGITNVLSDGKMEWEMKKTDREWRITTMSYTPRGQQK